mgnify:CR=1 FL=1
MAIQSCFERYEKKYCLTPSQQHFLLERMTPYMKKDAYGEYTICNIYYDTDDFRLICASLEKPIYKEKLRVRSYGVPDGDGKVFSFVPPIIPAQPKTNLKEKSLFSLGFL